jgi:hypothetical protein
MYTRAIKVAAQQIGLPVMVKTLSDRMTMALEGAGKGWLRSSAR